MATTTVVVVMVATSGIDPFRISQLATVGAMFCAVAGLTLLAGTSGQISVGQGALMAVGAYAVALTQQRFIDDGWTETAALIASLVIAVLATGMAGYVLGQAGARLQGPYLAGLTLALVVAVPAVANIFKSTFNGENGLPVPYSLPPDGLAVTVEQWQALYALIGAGLVFVALANLMRRRHGRTWKAVRDDEVAASLAGVQTGRLRVLAFTVSACCAGLGGGLLASLSQQASPGGFGLDLSIRLLTAIVLGGLGSLAGALWGSLLIVFLPDWLATFVAGLALSPAQEQRLQGNLPLVIYGVALVLVVLFAPSGLQGALRRVRLWSGRAVRRRHPESRPASTTVGDEP